MDFNQNWSEVKGALLEGLDQSKVAIVDRLLENTRAELQETATPGATDTSSIAGFRKMLLPMIRRTIPNSIGTEIVGVQPMQSPVAQVFTMRYRYVDGITPAAGSASAIDHGVGAIDPSVDAEAFGNVNLIRRYYSGATDVGAQPAGAGGVGAPMPGGVTGDATGAGWGSALDAAYVGAQGAAGSLYGGGGSHLEGAGGRRMTLEVVSQAVEARSRKLQASWTLEAMQDMNKQHGLDIENEMVRGLSAEIVQEIDNEIITDLISLAGTVATFDGSMPAAPGYYRPTFVGDRMANLGVMVSYLANEIARKTRRGEGNFLVCSPMVVTLLQAAAKSQFAPVVNGSFKGPNDTRLVGILNGKIKVYSYLWNNAQTTDVGGSGNDTILIGYKGSQNGETDSGYFYCPYVPLTSTGVMMNPVTTQPVVGLMTRYGKAIFDKKATSLGNSSDYYAKLNINALSFA